MKGSPKAEVRRPKEGVALTRAPFWTPLLALDRLNSWLRAEQPFCCPLRGALKQTIYWTKAQAILDASKRWHIGLRRVFVVKGCRTCGGSGIWTPWWGDCDCCDTAAEFKANHGERCRNCHGTGKAVLKFIETTIGPIRWHTPAHKWYMSSLDVYVPFASYAYDEWSLNPAHYEATDWQPNQKGRGLSRAEAERDVLILLEAYPHEVCFHLDYDHRLGLEKQWRCPDLAKAKEWLRALFHPEFSTSNIQHPTTNIQ